MSIVPDDITDSLLKALSKNGIGGGLAWRIVNDALGPILKLLERGEPRAYGTDGQQEGFEKTSNEELLDYIIDGCDCGNRHGDCDYCAQFGPDKIAEARTALLARCTPAYTDD